MTLVLLFSAASGCTRATSQAGNLTVQWTGERSLSTPGSPSFETLLRGTSAFGSEAISSHEDLDCIAVIVNAGSVGETCETTSGMTLPYSHSAGFAPRSQGVSVDITAGPARVIRVLGVKSLNGSCPTFAELDRLKISRPRVIAEVTKDLSGGPNVLEVTPNYSGAEIDSCSSNKIKVVSKACDLVTAPGFPIETDEIIVHMSDNELVTDLQSQFASLGMTHDGGWPEVNSHHFMLPGGVTPSLAASYLCQSPMVQFVEGVEEFFDARLSNSTLDSSAGDNTKALVAVVSTGFEVSHTLFSTTSGAIWENPADIGADEDGNGYPGDINGWNFFDDDDDIIDGDGLGTGISGAVLSAAVDITSAATVTSPIEILTVKVADATGTTDATRIASGIIYAADSNADVIAYGFGSLSSSEIIRRALIYASNRGVLIVAPAGNSSSDNDLVAIYPAGFNIDNVISVASVNGSNAISAFSNFGRYSVDIAATGVGVVTLTAAGGLATLSGTSLSVGLVAGAAAVAKNGALHLSGYQLKQSILDTANVQALLTNKVLTNGVLEATSLTTDFTGRTGESYSQPEQ